MAGKPFTKEELNFFKFASIVLEEFPKLLRQTFIKMWDNRIAPLPGYQVWDDSPAVRNLLLAREGGKTDLPTNKSINEWDCTALFKATIYSKSFGLTKYLKGKKKPIPFHATLISPTGDQDESLTLAIDQLRLLRNILCHIPKPILVKIDFDQYIQVAKDAFAVIGVASDRIDEISCLGEEDFPTNKMNELNERIKDELQQCNKFLEDEVIQKLCDQEENMALVFQKLDEIKEGIKSADRATEFLSQETKSDDIVGSTSSTLLTEYAPFSKPVSVNRPDGKTYKSMLNEYCQSIFKAVPQYKELPINDEHSKEFRSQVTIFDKTFECLGTYPNKKMSEEMAAKVAMEYFISTPAESLNSVSVSGKECVGSNSGSGNEKREEADGASVIATALKNEKISIMTEERPTEPKFTGNTPKSLSRSMRCSSEEVKFDNNTETVPLESFTDSKKFPVPPSVAKPDGKTSKSMLYEYCQKMGVEPDFRFTQDECSGEFIGVVTILDETFESIGSFTTKKVAKEMVAKEAMKHFNRISSESGIGSDVSEVAGECRVSVYSGIATTVEGDTESSTSMKEAVQAGLPELTENISKSLPSQIKPNQDKAHVNEAEAKSDVIADVKQPHSFTKKTISPLESNDGKTWKSILSEYGQSTGADIKFDDMLSTDPRNNASFRSVCTILEKSFETVEYYPTKKTAKEMAAKEAVLYFRAFSTLKGCLDERNLDYSLKFVTTQDSKTNKHFSKIYLGKRCFKGKQPKFTRNEAEIHVIETAIDTFNGHSGIPSRHFRDALEVYHEKLSFEGFPKYEEAKKNGNGNFICEAKVKKRYEFVCEDRKPAKNDVKNCLAVKAVQVLEDEKRNIPVAVNARSRLNLFLQLEDGETKLKIDIQEESGKFYGSLSFYVVDSYESLTPQPTKEDAIASSAISACNAVMDLF